MRAGTSVRCYVLYGIHNIDAMSLMRCPPVRHTIHSKQAAVMVVGVERHKRIRQPLHRNRLSQLAAGVPAHAAVLVPAPCKQAQAMRMVKGGRRAERVRRECRVGAFLLSALLLGCVNDCVYAGRGGPRGKGLADKPLQSSSIPCAPTLLPCHFPPPPNTPCSLHPATRALALNPPSIVCMTMRATESGSVHDAPLNATAKEHSVASGKRSWTYDPVNSAGSCKGTVEGGKSEVWPRDGGNWVERRHSEQRRLLQGPYRGGRERLEVWPKGGDSQENQVKNRHSEE